MRGAFTAADAHAAAADAGGLCDRASAVRADAQLHVATFLARGDTATPVKALARRPSRSTSRSRSLLMDRSGAGRARARDLDRRLDQFRAARRGSACAPELHPLRRAIQARRSSSLPSRASRSRGAAGSAQWPVLRCRRLALRNEADAAAARLGRRARLWRRVLGLFGRAVAGDLPRAGCYPLPFLRRQSERAARPPLDADRQRAPDTSEWLRGHFCVRMVAPISCRIATRRVFAGSTGSMI